MGKNDDSIRRLPKLTYLVHPQNNLSERRLITATYPSLAGETRCNAPQVCMISPVNIAELICILCNSGRCLTNFICALMLTIIGSTLVRLVLITFNSQKA